MKLQYSIPTIDYHQIKDPESSQRKVVNILKKLNLTPSRSVAMVIKDKTRIHYTDAVTDKQGRQYFIKIKLFKDELNNYHLYKNKVINEILINHPDLKLNAFTPRLVAYDDDFLLYEYVKGVNLGTRRFYNVIKAKLTDIPAITDIIQAVVEFPSSLLPGDFEKHGWHFLMFQLFVETRYEKDKHIFLQYFTKRELELIEGLKNNQQLQSLVEKNAIYFSHGDFKPSNLLKSRDTINAIDWDLSSIGIKYYDLVKFYLVSYRKPLLKKTFLEEGLRKIKFSENDRILLILTLFCLLFLECKVLIDRLNSDYNGKKKDFNVMKRLFAAKLVDAKYYLNELYKLI